MLVLATALFGGVLVRSGREVGDERRGLLATTQGGPLPVCGARWAVA